LVPKERTGAGYRLYDEDDLLRLQQILLGREQGLALEEIRRSLDDPRFDRKQALYPLPSAPMLAGPAPEGSSRLPVPPDAV
jgi:DNA-binding transcriptional MerR regulator